MYHRAVSHFTEAITLITALSIIDATADFLLESTSKICTVQPSIASVDFLVLEAVLAIVITAHFQPFPIQFEET